MTGPAASTSAGELPRRAGAATRVRATRQGAAVEAALAQADGFRSAQDLHAEIRRRGEAVGLTTVYRHLTTLADNGTVDTVQNGDVVCRRCGASVEVDDPAVEAWAEQVAAAAGYTDVSHTLEVFGTCAPCGAAPGTG